MWRRGLHQPPIRPNLDCPAAPKILAASSLHNMMARVETSSHGPHNSNHAHLDAHDVLVYISSSGSSMAIIRCTQQQLILQPLWVCSSCCRHITASQTNLPSACTITPDQSHCNQPATAACMAWAAAAFSGPICTVGLWDTRGCCAGVGLYPRDV